MFSSSQTSSQQAFAALNSVLSHRLPEWSSRVELRHGEVHLWRTSVDISSTQASALGLSLSPAERGRAERFRTAGDAGSYIGRRAWLRLLLSRYLGENPASLNFEVAEHGKPRLASLGQRWLRFNISDSGSVVVCIVARDREVGIDVERIRTDIDIEAVSRRFLSATQRHELLALPPQARTASFFAMWTRNEAYLKAIGTGLAGTDRNVDLDEVAGWSLGAFDAGTGFAAAVAVEGVAAVPAGASDMPL
jgi:4'-phosphopantetheinyl transferase